MGNVYTQIFEGTIYVDSSQTEGTHDGSSWENACQTIDQAFTEGMQYTDLTIKFAKGTYYPSTPFERGGYNFPRNRYSLQIVGGYPSLPSDDAQPDPEHNRTIISGDYDKNDQFNASDSTYIIRNNNLHSVLKLQVSDSCKIFGVWIVGGTGGQSIDPNKGALQYDHFIGGGGLYIEIPGTLSINKCVFTSNTSQLTGGALAVFTNNHCLIENSVFINNKSFSTLNTDDPQFGDNKLGGGAIYVRSTASLMIKNSIIKRCEALNAGGGINFQSNGNLIIENTSFERNEAGSEGGAVYCLTSGSCMISDYTFRNHFSMNKAKSGCGGAVFVRLPNNLNINGYSFTGNSATGSGGALCFYGPYLNLNKTEFKDNVANTNGGAALHYGVSFKSQSTSFFRNLSERDGGALLLGCSYKADFKDCSFKENISTNGNGGAFFGGANSYVNFSNTQFINDTAKNGNGGSVYFDKGIFKTERNTLFSNNYAKLGGCVYFADCIGGASTPLCKISNTVFDRNVADTGSVFYNSITFKNLSEVYRSKFINNRTGGNGTISFNDGNFYANCLFADNNVGSGKIIQWDPTITDVRIGVNFCTFANNQAATILNNSKIVFNSIIYNTGSVSLLNCGEPYRCLTNDSVSGTGNIIGKDPKFVMSGESKYALLSLSPAKDKADYWTYFMFNMGRFDLAGNLRLDQITEVADIGAYECQETHRWYVDSSKAISGVGTSWDAAFRTLQEGLKNAKWGDSILVANGTYYPDSGTGDRNKFFQVAEGVTLLGGFYGTETDLSKRDWVVNPTILSGEVGNPLTNSDNSEKVLVLNNSSLVEGFIIKQAGIGVSAERSEDVTIRKCKFTDLYSYAIQANQCPVLGIDKCYFSENKSAVPGNVGYCINIERSDEIDIKNSVFYKNKKSDLLFDLSNGSVQNCTFYKDDDSAISCNGSSLEFYNNIIWKNSSTSTVYDILLYSSYDSATNETMNSNLNIDYCYLKYGQSGIYSNLQSVSYGLNMLIDSIADPGFIDTSAGNLRLKAESPFVDVGDPFIVSTDNQFDIDGNMRIFGTRVDLGAFELQRAIVPLKPILVKIERSCAGQPYTAIFGYENPNTFPVTRTVGPLNFFNNSLYTNQITWFSTGRNLNAFSVSFNDLSTGEVIRWSLDGNSVEITKDKLPTIISTPSLSTELNKFSVAAGGSLILDLDKKDTNNNGVYVSYSCCDISDLTWTAEPVGLSSSSPLIGLSFNTETHELTISPSPDYAPGQMFSIKVRAADPLHNEIAAEKIITVSVVKSGFDVQNIALTHLDNGTFSGSLESARHSTELSLSQGRLYIYEGLTGTTTYDRTKMKFIDQVNLNNVSLPKSMGGIQEFGKYTFDFIPSEKIVYNPDGSSTGLHLHEWARKNAIISKDKKMTFVLPLRTVYDEVAMRQVTVNPVDFDGPYFSYFTVTENSSSSQKLEWNNNENIDSLRLTITPIGDGASAPLVIDLTSQLPILTYTVTGLQDSRLYRYTISATDTRGNNRIIQTEKMTLSGHYTISGKVDGPFNLANVSVKVQLLKCRPEGKYTVIDSTNLSAAKVYSFADVENGSYVVRPVLTNYYGIPVEDSIQVLRLNMTDIDFMLSPLPLVAKDGVTVRQLPTTGDLEITAQIPELYPTEELNGLRLRWTNDYTDETDSELFTGLSYTSSTNADSSITWTCIIPRSAITSQILDRTHSFDEYIRYVDAEIITKTSEFTPFRISKWGYPIAQGSHILFAPQWFRKPVKPDIISVRKYTNDVKFTLRNNDDALGQFANVSITSLDASLPKISKQYDMGLAFKESKTPNWILAVADWKKAISSISLGNTQYLSGYISGAADAFVPCGRFYPPETATGSLDYNTPHINFRVYAPEDDNYIIWLHVEKTKEDIKANKVIKVNIGVNGTVYNSDDHTGTIGSITSGWVRVTDNIFTNCGPRVISLHQGINTVTIYNTSTDIAFNAIALQKENNTTTWCKGAPPQALFDTYDDSTAYNKQITLSDFNLLPNRLYEIATVIYDRYGNSSDTTYDTVKTRDQYYLKDLIVSQEETTGDLLMSFNPQDDDIEQGSSIDTVVIKLSNGTEKKFNQHVPLSKGAGPFNIRITRDQLGSLLDDTLFSKKCNYLNSRLVIGNEIEHTDHYCKKEFIIRKFYSSREKGTCGKCGRLFRCTNEEVNWTEKSIASYEFNWPGISSSVASQQYEKPLKPVLSAREVEPFKITLNTIDLNRNTDGTAKQQMTGALTVSWEPGSNCENKTTRTYPVGNRFTLNNEGWIAFKPCFESAIKTVNGTWRSAISGTMGGAHQWLDHYNGTTLDSGGFQPNVNVRIEASELSGLSLASVPRISMGIRLKPGEGTQSTSDDEKFLLWVKPALSNGLDNDEFYWGIDGTPMSTPIGSAAPGSAGTNGWVQGPMVSLGDGDHTIDLFMCEDGVKIEGIALSKVKSEPTYDASALSGWGNDGLTVDVVADHLYANKEITFTASVTDRFGNNSEIAQQKITTPPTTTKLPLIVFNPVDIYNNGWFATSTPQIALRVQDLYSGTLSTPEFKLLRYQGSSTLPTDLTSQLQISSETDKSWIISLNAGESLADYPVTGKLSDTNGYVLLARTKNTLNQLGDWSSFQFGVKSGTIPSGVVLEDSLFTLGTNLRFKYIYGLDNGDGTLTGDLQVLFNDNIDASFMNTLIYSGVTITKGQVDGKLGIVDIGTDGFFKAGNFADDGSGISESKSQFVFPYGKFEVRAETKTMILNKIDQRIEAGESSILDDNTVAGKMSVSSGAVTAIPFDSRGITSDFYTSENHFVLKDIVKFSDAASGFNIESCVTRFSFNTATKTYTISTRGGCAGCGPYLFFDVIDPRYSGSAFHVFDKLDRTLDVTYTADNFNYNLKLASSEPPFTVTNSDLPQSEYDGWQMKLHSYTFDKSGVHLTNFDVEANREVFPAKDVEVNLSKWTEKTHSEIPSTIKLNQGTNGRFITGFSGGTIMGKDTVGNGALYLYGDAEASGTGVSLTTQDLFTLKNVTKFQFKSNGSNRNFLIETVGTERIIDVPAGYQRAFYFDGQDENGQLSVPISTLTLSSDGIESLVASKSVIFHHGSYNDNKNWSLTFNSTLKLTARERLVDVALVNKSGESNGDNNVDLKFDNGFFNFSNGSHELTIPNSKLVLTNELQISSIDAKKTVSTEDAGITFNPEEASILTLSTGGLSLEKSGDTLLMRFNTPKFKNLDNELLSIPADLAMNSAVFGLDKRIVHTSAALFFKFWK